MHSWAHAGPASASSGTSFAGLACVSNAYCLRTKCVSRTLFWKIGKEGKLQKSPISSEKGCCDLRFRPFSCWVSNAYCLRIEFDVLQKAILSAREVYGFFATTLSFLVQNPKASRDEWIAFSAIRLPQVFLYLIIYIGVRSLLVTASLTEMMLRRQTSGPEMAVVNTTFSVCLHKKHFRRTFAPAKATSNQRRQVAGS